jgi:type 1 fimbria pilin
MVNTYAACTPFDTSWTVNPGHITVHSSDPIGTSYLYYPMDFAGYECRDNATYVAGIKSYAPSLNYTGGGRAYFDSGVKGIGFALAANAASDLWILPGRTEVSFNFMSGPADYYWKSSFEFVKTGPVTGGVFNSGRVAAYTLSENSAWQPETPINMGSGSVTVIQDSCSLITPSAETSLGTWNVQYFTGIGMRTTSTPINLNFSCGNAGVKVLATITADADASQPGTIKINSGTTPARGLGVQVVDAYENPIPLNTQFTVTTSTNAGIYTPGWKAHYIQTEAGVFAGEGDASLSVIFNYE